MERQREDINRDYYAVLDKQNENMHIMVHDIKKHLGVIAVSYTHLDVYKRQAITLAALIHRPISGS